jgi:hypothetical protein
LSHRARLANLTILFSSTVGMKEDDFRELADDISEIVLRGRSLAAEVSRYRRRLTEMKYCLPAEEANPLIEKLSAFAEDHGLCPRMNADSVDN